MTIDPKLTPLQMRRRLIRAWILSLAAPCPASAQGVLGGDAGETVDGVGWAGFADVAFMAHALLVLLLAAALGAVIAYHPRTRARVDSVDEAEAPKIYLTYAVVGAVIGLMVVEYGLVVGFVVFGIGGLFRFRTALPSASSTGRLILVTLVGLSCGLDLPHLGVLATAFGFVLILATDRVVSYRLDVKGLEPSILVDAAAAYRACIEAAGGEIIRERRRFSRSQLAFVVRAPNAFQREALERSFEAEIPAGLQGAVDWEVD